MTLNSLNYNSSKHSNNYSYTTDGQFHSILCFFGLGKSVSVSDTVCTTDSIVIAIRNR